MEIWNGWLIVIVGFSLKNVGRVKDVGESVEWVILLVELLIDEGFLVEFIDISEKNNLRIVSVFDIGE